MPFRVCAQLSDRPHLGGGRRILPGQMLHSSIMESGIGASYTPRASFEHDHDSSSGTSFTTDWQKLLDIKHREVELPQWIEQDLYHLALRLMKDIRRLLTDPNETDRRRPLQQMLTTLIDSRTSTSSSLTRFVPDVDPSAGISSARRGTRALHYAQ